MAPLPMPSAGHTRRRWLLTLGPHPLPEPLATQVNRPYRSSSGGPASLAAPPAQEVQAPAKTPQSGQIHRPLALAVPPCSVPLPPQALALVSACGGCACHCRCPSSGGSGWKTAIQRTTATYWRLKNDSSDGPDEPSTARISRCHRESSATRFSSSR